VGLERLSDIIDDLLRRSSSTPPPRESLVFARRDLWKANDDGRQRILAHGFVRGLGDGSLPVSISRAMAQDAFPEAFALAYAFFLANSTELLLSPGLADLDRRAGRVTQASAVMPPLESRISSNGTDRGKPKPHGDCLLDTATARAICEARRSRR